MTHFRSMAIAILLSFSVLVPGAANAHGGSQYTGTTGTLLDAGGSFSRYVSRYVGPFRSVVNVQLSGWELNYRYSDHHIDRASVRIESVSYNVVTGYVSFYVRGAYDDQNDDDDFYWRANYSILALN